MPKPVSLQMRRILPSIHLAKMPYYFDDHGCLRCARGDILYGGNGIGENCSVIVRGRLANCLKRRFKRRVSWRIFPRLWAIVPLVPEKLSAGQGCTERVADLPRLLHGNTVNYGWRITRVSSITDLLRSI